MLENIFMWDLNPLQSQLGQAYTCRIYLPFILIKQRAWSAEKSCSSKGKADKGGIHGLPAKHILTTLLRTDVNPRDVSLVDERRSEVISYLNYL